PGEPVWNYGSGGLEKFCCDLVKHLAFKRDRFGQHHVKGGDPVGNHYYQRVLKRVDIPHFTLVKSCLSGKIKIRFFNCAHEVKIRKGKNREKVDSLKKKVSGKEPKDRY